MDNQKTSVDEVLGKFSMFGRYHLQFMMLAMFAYLTCSTYSHTYIFVTEKTGYRCADAAFNNNTCGTVNGMRCTKWIYDNPNSFAAEFDLACQEWKRTFVGTAYSFGYMVGLFLVGFLSDRIGRKMAFIATAMAAAVIGLTKSFCNSYWLYVTLECLGPLLGDIYSPLFVINLEIISSKKRVIFIMLCTLSSSFSGCLLAVAAWGVPYWRNLLQSLYIPSFLLIAFCLIDESPRWLLSKGKKEKAIAILQKMAKKNKMALDDNALNNLIVEDKGITLINQLKMTFESRALLKRFLVCIVWWIASTFVNYGTMINSVSLQGNKYVNYALMDLVDLPGNFIIMYVLDHYKRKNPLICTFFAAAILFFIHPFLPNDLPWLSVILYMVSRFMSSSYFSITYIYTSELFPTYTRNSMHAMCSAIGRIGSITATQTPLLMVYWSGLPALVFGCASLVGGLVTLLVPDTADYALPDNVQDAENIGHKHRTKQLNTGIDNLAMTQTKE